MTNGQHLLGRKAWKALYQRIRSWEADIAALAADAFECTGLQHSFTKFREPSSRGMLRLRQTSQ